MAEDDVYCHMPTTAKRSLLPLAALLFVLAVAACAEGTSTAGTSAPLPGEALLAEAAYKFTLPSGLNGDVSLDSYAGERNVVLVFYRGFW